MIIVDAGGGTVDISAYRRRVTNGDFEEIAAPQCKCFQLRAVRLENHTPMPCSAGYFHGSVFVTLHAKLFLTRTSLTPHELVYAVSLIHRLQIASETQTLQMTSIILQNDLMLLLNFISGLPLSHSTYVLAGQKTKTHPVESVLVSSRYLGINFQSVGLKCRFAHIFLGQIARMSQDSLRRLSSALLMECLIK